MSDIIDEVAINEYAPHLPSFYTINQDSRLKERQKSASFVFDAGPKKGFCILFEQNDIGSDLIARKDKKYLRSKFQDVLYAPTDTDGNANNALPLS